MFDGDGAGGWGWWLELGLGLRVGVGAAGARRAWRWVGTLTGSSAAGRTAHGPCLRLLRLASPAAPSPAPLFSLSSKEKQLKRKEAKAEAAAQLDQAIEKELLARLQVPQGILPSLGRRGGRGLHEQGWPWMAAGHKEGAGGARNTGPPVATGREPGEQHATALAARSPRRTSHCRLSAAPRGPHPLPSLLP